MKMWLLLDFDNTLMHTDIVLPSLIHRFNELYEKEIGRSLTLEEFQKQFHGQARENLCTNMSKYFGITVRNNDLYDKREERVQAFIKQEKIPMAPHLMEALKALKNKGYKFAVVTNNPISRAVCAMENSENGQGLRLLELLEGNMFEAGKIQKPNPDVYLRAMKSLDTTPDKCIAIEDSITGAQAALSAGIKTFGYTYYGQDPDQMKDIGVDRCFQDWLDIARALTVRLEPFEKEGILLV